MTTQRTIAGRKVSGVGYGAAGLSVGPHPPEDQAIDTLLAALEAGVTIIDSAACYVPSHSTPGHNEILIAKALAQWDGPSDEVMVVTKAGQIRIATGGSLETDFRGAGRPEEIRQQCEISLGALGVDAIDVYQLHDPRTGVPLAEMMGAFKELRDEGKIRNVGLSNVSIAQIQETQAIVDVVSVQNSFSPGNRASADVLAHCDREGIAFMAYSPLGGLGDRARDMPEHNPAFAAVAAERGVSPHRVALAWELSLSDVMIPLPGARRRVTMEDSAAAMDLVLDESELARLNGDG